MDNVLDALVRLHAVAKVDRDEDYAAIANAAEVIQRASAGVEPDRHCVTTPDGGCVSEDARCMHNRTAGITDEQVMNAGRAYTLQINLGRGTGAAVAAARRFLQAPSVLASTQNEERKAFEQRCYYAEGAIEGCIALDRDEDGDYTDLDTDAEWEVWQRATKWQREHAQQANTDKGDAK